MALWAAAVTVLGDDPAENQNVYRLSVDHDAGRTDDRLGGLVARGSCANPGNPYGPDHRPGPVLGLGHVGHGGCRA